ncbi:MAG: YicC family protein [Paenibacillaceae bacterium]|uniref:YicC family protein n=1 Tax=Paenibacillus mellifer TaxID=2937794 RepID=A0A9X1XU83_9BACL|nr:YicC/YloC family endoribonuclease [Paenibacillus mellifer]MBW4839363.1 YicC family protein [Paenibacillaceae bacterium]MCK8486130.1 YicC family protein [Paenibacillus mellifer]
MSHSMTGYGGAVRSYGGYVVQFEIKSVNHRYAEVVLRMPREWTCYEDGLRRLVQRHIKRGRIDVYISKERDESGTLPYVLNRPVVEAYLKAAGELATHYGVDAKISAKDLLSLPDALTAPAEVTPTGSAEPDWEQVLTDGLEEALIGLLGMREREGKHLAADLEQRLQRLEAIHGELVRLAPEVVSEYRSRLKVRLAELLDGNYDEQRFAMEVAVFADRSNIDEELIRLKSHFEQCHSLLQAYEPVGRKLDFLIQEMNRETNTIGSKANHLALVNLVVEMKAELEKIREQAANLE